jgi:hypothetical protein
MNNLKKHFNFKRAKRTKEQIDSFIKKLFKNSIIGNLIITEESFSFDVYSKLSYEALVNKLVREKYTESEEFAILRKHQKGVNEDEFNEYDTYVEECKEKAKQFIAEREKAVVE